MAFAYLSVILRQPCDVSYDIFATWLVASYEQL